ncbi:hypothetical protein DIPPA_25812 [Diplonema papillatum]|nr:hypothetical protein DIPPA_25812 [Diplonema papillatum]|eukprot:gene9723-15095_t
MSARLFVAACLLSVSAAMTVREQVVFQNTSRFPYVHMTMIEQVNATRYLFAFQASHTWEGYLDQRICLQVSDDGGRNWTKPIDLIFGRDASGNAVPVWGPVLFHNPKTGVTYLYYSQSVPKNIRPGTPPRHFPGGDICVIQSTDGGDTWTPVPERKLLLPYDSPTRGNVSKVTANKPVFLNQAQTEWALPFWQEAKPENKNDTGPRCGGVLVTVDGGASYSPIGFVNSSVTYLIENTIVPLTALPAVTGFGSSALRLVQYFRSQIQVGMLYESFSNDGGATWSAPTTTPQGWQNPDSKVSAAAELDGAGVPSQVLLALNPNATLKRDLLAVVVSEDAGPWASGSVSFGSETTIGVTTAAHPTWNWSYPTVLKRAEPSLWAVSFSAFGTEGAKVAWIDTAP